MTLRKAFGLSCSPMTCFL